MSRLKRCLVLSPGAADATSFWRAHGPISHLSKIVDDWEFVYVEKLQWVDIAYADVVFLQRPFTKEHRQIVDVVKSMNTKLWVEYDDLLYKLERANPVYHFYMKKECHDNIDYIASKADIVSVVTQDLKKHFEKRIPREYQVIENAWLTHIVPWKKRQFIPHKRIFWRGSQSHDKDLGDHFESIKAIVRDFPDWEWVFIGAPPYQVMELIPNQKLHMVPTLDIVTYFNALRVMEASVAIVPLQDCDFNHCKSNIAWQEATFAGCITLGPNFQEWQMAGLAHYESTELGLYEAFCAHHENGALLDLSFKSIEQNRTIDLINLKRKEILKCI